MSPNPVAPSARLVTTMKAPIAFTTVNMPKEATARKLLEWIHHILKDGRTYQEMERIADLLGRGEPGNPSGSA